MTNWIDLDANFTSNATVVDSCTLTTAQRTNPAGVFDDYPGSRLVIDYSTCNSAVNLGAGTLASDVALIFAANKLMDVSVNGALTSPGGQQLWLVHADTTLNNKVPNCGDLKKQGQSFVPIPDDFDVAAGLNVTTPILVYSPCGLQGNLQSDFTGQLYTNSDDTRAVHSIFDCEPMSWEPYLPKLSCTIKGEDGAEGSTEVVMNVGQLKYQAEQ